MLVRSYDHISQLASYLSSKHPNIRFTYEIEKQNQLPFLDVDVLRENGKFSTSVHRKNTFSGVFTNFKAFLPEVYKKGLIATLLHRAYMINSSFITLHKEVEKLKSIFKKNGYPANFIDKCISNFFNKIHKERTPVTDEPKEEYTISLPFLGTTSWIVKNHLMRSVKAIRPTCNLKIVFKSSNRLASFFAFKDKLPKSLMSGVIYHYNCARCNLSYVGSTKRFWEKRLEEHIHISSFTGKPVKRSQIYAPMKHVQSECSHDNPVLGRNDFKIIGREDNPYVLRIKESIFIYKLKPELNDNDSAVPLYLFKN